MQLETADSEPIEMTWLCLVRLGRVQTLEAASNAAVSLDGRCLLLFASAAADASAATVVVAALPHAGAARFERFVMSLNTPWLFPCFRSKMPSDDGFPATLACFCSTLPGGGTAALLLVTSSNGALGGGRRIDTPVQPPTLTKRSAPPPIGDEAPPVDAEDGSCRTDRESPPPVLLPYAEKEAVTAAVAATVDG